MQRGRQLLSGAVIAAFVLIGGLAAGPPAAAADPGLSWTSAATVALPTTGAKPATVSVRNDTGRALTASAASSDTALVTVRPATFDLAAGESTALTVKVAAAAGAGTATITVVAQPAEGLPAGAVLRRMVTVGAKAAAMPAVDSVDAISRFGLPGNFSTDPVVPLASPARCELLDASGLTSLGYLQADGGHRAVVRASCHDAHGRAELHLAFAAADGSELPRTGAVYSGKIQFGDKAVAVSVRRTSVLVWPIVALVVGLGVALFILARKPAGLIGHLRRRLKAASARIGTAAAPGPALIAFRERADGAAWGDLNVFADLTEQGTAISADMDQLGGIRRFTLSADDSRLKGIDDKITGLEDGAAALSPLATTLAGLSDSIRVVDATRFIPAWVEQTRRSLLGAAEVPVASLKQRLATAQAAAAFARAFPAVALQLTAMIHRMGELRAGRDQLSEADRKRVDAAQELVTIAVSELQLPATNDAVGQVIDNEVKQARVAVEALQDIALVREAVAAAGGVGSARSLTDVHIALPADAELVAPSVGTERALSLLAVAIVAVLLVCAGLQTLVIGKAFGTAWDYVRAFAWGAGSTAVAAPLVAAWETYAAARAERSDRPPAATP